MAKTERGYGNGVLVTRVLKSSNFCLRAADPRRSKIVAKISVKLEIYALIIIDCDL